MSEEHEESSGEQIEHGVEATIILNNVRETFTLDPLDGFSSRIKSLDIDPSGMTITPLITGACASTKKMSKEDERRVEEALSRGQNYFQRVPLDNDDYLSRSQRFSTELDYLEQIFSTVSTVVTPSGTRACGVDPNLIRKLTGQLAHRRLQAKESLLLAGVEVPSLPEWGPYNNLEAFWRMNEFEIYVACYRKEVGCFLAYLGKYHKFVEVRPNRKSRQKGKRDDKSSVFTSTEEVGAILNTSTPRRKPRRKEDSESYVTPGRKG